MKKILVVDPLSYNGHINGNLGLIKAISSNYDYDVIVNEKHADSFVKHGFGREHLIYVYPNKWNIAVLSKRMNKLLYHLVFRFYFVKLLLHTKLISSKYDAIFITCIDVYAFCLISWLFDKNLYVIDHGIGNVSDNWLYRLGWRFTNNKINVIVLEDFIRAMVSKIFPYKTIETIRHPLPIDLRVTKNCKCAGNVKLLFAPSASNDNDFLDLLRKTPIPGDVKIVAKTTSIDFVSDNVKLYSQYLAKDEYDDYMNNAEYILLPYSPSYNYRISGVLFEALFLKKPVLILNNNTLSYYGSIFTGSICLFDNLDDLFFKVRSFVPDMNNNNLSDYSNDCLSKRIYELIG